MKILAKEVSFFLMAAAMTLLTGRGLIAKTKAMGNIPNGKTICHACFVPKYIPHRSSEATFGLEEK